MKKSIILSLALVAPAFAGEPVAPVTVVEPAPAPAPCWAVEVGPHYTLATRHLGTGAGDLDMGGIDITGLYNVDDKWAVTLRFSWAEGDAYCPHEHNTATQEYFVKDVDGQAWSIMPGVRYTSPITEDLDWFVGANVGINNLELETAWESHDATGFGYSAETGLKYQVIDNLYIYGAVQVSGSTADPNGIRHQFGYGIRAGVGFEF